MKTGLMAGLYLLVTASPLLATTRYVAAEPVRTVLASDDASNYVSDWSGNGGFGFEPWTFDVFAPPDYVRAYLADANTYPGLTIGTPPDGVAWGLDAAPDIPCYIMAVRPFPTNGLNALGQTFAVSMECGPVGSSEMAAVGVILRRAEGFSERERVEFAVQGGKSTYTVFDAAGPVDTGIAIRSDGIRLAFTLTGPDAYQLAISQAGDGAPIGTVTGTLDNWGPIDEAILYNASAGTNHVRFNSLTILDRADVSTTTTTTSSTSTTTTTTTTTTTAEPCLVVTVDPPNAAVAAPVAGPISVTFSAAIDPDTVNSNTFRVWGRRSGLRSGTYLSAPTRFVPDQPFFAGEWVDVTLTAGVQATNGALLRPHAWSFTTKALGSTNFSFVLESATGGQPRQRPVMGDLDGDGDLDAWVACWYSSDYIWINTGDGQFTAGMNLPLPSRGFYQPIMEDLLADINGDGRLDGLPLNPENPGMPPPDPGLATWINDGNGKFAADTEHFGQAWGYGRGILRDLDVDGDPDALLFFDPYYFPSMRGALTNLLYRNDGHGRFDAGEPVTILTTGSVFQAVAADLDADGDPDLAFAGLYEYTVDGTTLTIALNENCTAFVPSQQLALTNFLGGTAISLGDLDGDGDFDAVLAHSQGHHAILVNDGRAVFTVADNMDTGERTGTPIGLADIDGDGDLDAVIASDSEAIGSGRVMLNDGHGIFSPSAVLPPDQVWGMEVADIDQDGDLDLVYGGTHPKICRHWSCSEVGADLQGPAEIGAGQPFAYAICYSNNGPVGARGLTLTADLPDTHFDVQGYVSDSIPAAVFVTNTPSWTWRLGGVLDPGQGGTLTVTGIVHAAAVPGVVSAQVAVAVAEIDDDTANNADTALTLITTPVPPVPDTDGDGMPDWWEIACGFDPGTSNAPGANADGDMATDWEEYIADSDPTNPASFFAITAVSNIAAWTVYVEASTARVYLLECATALTATTWSSVPGQTNVPGTDARDGLRDTNTTGFRAYRVGVRLP